MSACLASRSKTVPLLGGMTSGPSLDHSRGLPVEVGRVRSAGLEPQPAEPNGHLDVPTPPPTTPAVLPDLDRPDQATYVNDRGWRQ